MSVHAIYKQHRPKSSWHLVSVVSSPELANLDVIEIQNREKKNGNDQAKVAIQLFDTMFYVPENMNEIEEYIPIFN